jgi:STE24 endopeptidase
MSTIIFYFVIGIICFGYLLNRILDYLHLKSWSENLPQFLESFYSIDTYKKALNYHKHQDKLSFITETLNFLIILTVIISGVLGLLNHWIVTYTGSYILQALLFFGVLFFVSDVVNLPFSVYDTFILEEKFGFNRTTIKTFILDKLKSYVLLILIGGGLLSLIIWIITITGTYFWIYAFVSLTGFSFLMNFFYGSLIIPIFNKLNPLEDGELRQAIQEYASEVAFPLRNIYVINGSKRSSKSNAFFTGFGRKKKIVLYDTLISKHTTHELVAVLAHEIGHYKKKHVIIGLTISSLEMLLMLFVMSRFIFNTDFSRAFGSESFSLPINLIAFVIIYQPVSLLLGLWGNHLSRKHEFEADSFAVKTTANSDLGKALIKLSVDQLSNLTPHPLYVFFNYSHPPLLQRLKNINDLNDNITDADVKKKDQG